MSIAVISIVYETCSDTSLYVVDLNKCPLNKALLPSLNNNMIAYDSIHDPSDLEAELYNATTITLPCNVDYVYTMYLP